MKVKPGDIIDYRHPLTGGTATALVGKVGRTLVTLIPYEAGPVRVLTVYETDVEHVQGLTLTFRRRWAAKLARHGREQGITKEAAQALQEARDVLAVPTRGDGAPVQQSLFKGGF